MASWLLGLCLVVMTTTTVQAEITLDGCGTTKGCFRSPEDCSGPGHCGYFLSWRVDGAGNNVFEMAGDVATYVAVGFSKSGQMANSDVYACTSNNEVVRSRNTMGHKNEPSQPVEGVSNVSVSEVDGGIQCTFIRQASLNDNDETYYDLSGDNAYHIIMSKSGLKLHNGQIGYHYGGRVKGPRADFTSVTLPPKKGPGGGGGDGCGSTKGCFRSPDGCSGPNDCEFFLSWAKQGNSHMFQLAGYAETYVAVGFSLSGKMSNSDVYACTKNLEVVRSRNTVGNANMRDQPLKGVSDVSVTVSNGRIECTFSRQDSLNDNDDTYYNLRGNNKYSIIMAKSNRDLFRDGNIMYHFDGRVQGPEVSFNDFAETGAVVDMKLLLQRVHGCLMVIAWVGLASIGLTTARYFKPMAPGKKPCGKPVWFTIHRFFMVLTFCCTVAAFVIIFVATEGFVEMAQGMSGLDTRFIHAILGTLVTFLAIVNPIMAFFRPHPGTPKRPIFNWAHWAVGTSAHIIGQVTICFALVNVGSATPIIPQIRGFVFWIMIGFVAVHIIMWIILECRSRMKSDDEDDDIPLKGSGDPDTEFRESSALKEAKIRKLFFFIYLFLAVAFAAVIVVFIII